MTTNRRTATEVPGEVDAVVVGAGFAGLYMLHRLRGLGLETRVFEAGPGIGGTWFWNRYPGARCDVESMAYSYQFSRELQQEWRWSERYASQPEILRYAEHVADRFALWPHIQLATRVAAATFDEATNRWLVTTEAGARVAAKYCIMATGCLSSRNAPRFAGLADYEGRWYHTGDWPHQGVDFAGQRVGVIGTGSSAVQSIPIIAEQAKHLTVFQRTPNYSIPARNEPLDPAIEATVKADYEGFRQRAAATGFGIDLGGSDGSALEVPEAERRRAYAAAWERGGFALLGSYGDLILNQQANDSAADYVREKIRDVVKDPAVAEALCPTYPVGCKRLCLDTGFYETFNRPNVTLVDIGRSPIERITPRGVRALGREYELDSIVFAIGFDAMTGALFAIDIRGRGDLPLREKWAAGPRTYLGLQTAGFPNLFTITGPGSPSVLSNMLPSIEQHVNWIADCLAHLERRGLATIEPTADAEEQWVAHVNEVAGATLVYGCNSWYLGANVPGKPRVFMPYLGYAPYVEKCNQVVANGYEGFALAGG